MQGQTSKAILQGELQRNLRRNMTNAEQLLWTLLRGRQLAGLKFRRQHPFENYILDYVCLEKKIIIELDGGQHQAQIAEDMVRTDFLEHSGFTVLRFWNNEVLQHTEAVVERIWQVVSKTDPSSPRPSP